jgi:hypothetical protein
MAMPVGLRPRRFMQMELLQIQPWEPRETADDRHNRSEDQRKTTERK